MTNTDLSAHSCDACRIIDESDGKVDGRMFNLDHWDISQERMHFKRFRSREEKTTDKVTGFAGSMKFVYLHLVWFSIWIMFHIGVLGSSEKFDIGYNTLTMIVSLEAIFLSTLVMVTQNRQAKKLESRSQIDFESNLQSLVWSVHIADKLGVDVKHVEALCAEVIQESRQTN
jgi:uncharacterized membrane protein